MSHEALRLSLACNNRCVFCAQDGLIDSPASSLLESLRAMRARGVERVTLVGGEPLLHGELLETVRAARAEGFRAVELQTNGRLLGVDGAAQRLADSGLTGVQVTVLGAEATVHDYHAGVPGAFKALGEGIAAARRADLGVVAATVVTRSNFRVLGALPLLLKAWGCEGWMVLPARVAGRAAASFDRVVPRMAMIAPFVLHALEAARRAGLPAAAEGLPTCTLGPFASRAAPVAPRSFGQGCGACPARESCPGLEQPYLDRFGDEELLPLRAAPPEVDADTLALAARFAGVGELAIRPIAVAAEPPAAARRALPVLGKSRRAVAEQPGRDAPRQTGEALKKLFPSLFEGGAEVQPSEKKG